MNSRLLIPLLLAGAVALACGTRSHSDAAVSPAAKSSSAKSTSAKSASIAIKPGSAPIASEFKVRPHPKALEFALHVTNPTKKSVELVFPSGQEYEFSVMDSTGTEVYRWGSGRMFTQSLQNKLLDGGETLRIEERAEKTLPSGTYVAVATLRSTNYPMEQRYSFQLR
jgi:hypothetical protein